MSRSPFRRAKGPQRAEGLLQCPAPSRLVGPSQRTRKGPSLVPDAPAAPRPHGGLQVAILNLHKLTVWGKRLSPAAGTSGELNSTPELVSRERKGQVQGQKTARRMGLQDSRPDFEMLTRESRLWPGALSSGLSQEEDFISCHWGIATSGDPGHGWLPAKLLPTRFQCLCERERAHTSVASSFKAQNQQVSGSPCFFSSPSFLSC